MSRELIEKFEAIYGQKPTIAIRCPGRVNLIGEHIDYHGYGVFPMAIDASTTILAAKNETSTLNIRNANDKYPSWKSEVPSDWNGAAPPKWYDYILCGWKGVLDHEKHEQFGFDFLVTGDIPPSSGLSSSSSLVCASALATLSLIRPDPFSTISREDFAQLCANSEPLIGTLSGGMDQAAEVLATEGSALKIDFSPLRSKNISLPENAVFVVAHSNTELNKAATSHYNERVIEGRIIAQFLKQQFGITNKTFRLKEVQTLAEKSFEEILKVVDTLPDEVTKEEAENLIGKEKLEECLTENTRHLTSFKLRPRGYHVFSEALRVDQFEEACARKDIARMGELMNESHRSCAEDYECSCPELDEICRQYKAAGALGARLTGAGWGGCAVILFSANKAKNLENSKDLKPLFVSKPASGIEINYLH